MTFGIGTPTAEDDAGTRSNDFGLLYSIESTKQGKHLLPGHLSWLQRQISDVALLLIGYRAVELVTADKVCLGCAEVYFGRLSGIFILDFSSLSSRLAWRTNR